MALIFSASADSRSYIHSSRIIGPIVRWLFPHISEDTVNTIIFLVRKCAHLTEYGVLALLIWRALRKPVRSQHRPWSWREVRLALLLVAIYAASDEFHQIFVPTRDAELHDVLIDTCGGAAALLLLWVIGCWTGQWKINGGSNGAKKVSRRQSDSSAIAS